MSVNKGTVTDRLIQANEKVAELEAQLDAWHKTFGTSQLSHAQAKQERAQKDRKQLLEALNQYVELCNSVAIEAELLGSSAASDLASKLVKGLIPVNNHAKETIKRVSS